MLEDNNKPLPGPDSIKYTLPADVAFHYIDIDLEAYREMLNNQELLDEA